MKTLEKLISKHVKKNLWLENLEVILTLTIFMLAILLGFRWVSHFFKDIDHEGAKLLNILPLHIDNVKTV